MLRIADRIRSALDPDRALQSLMAATIEAAGVRYAINGPRSTWTPGNPLRLLLAGYVGTRNTGADVRVEEMIRQLRHIVGDRHLQLSVLTSDPALTAGYFRTARQLELPQVFPKFLFDQTTEHHGVLACEGSMFKSKFADALSTMMGGALGLACVEGKIAVGYGGEAGEMSVGLERFVRNHCRDALVICRNEPSQTILERLGIRTELGTDTAWTFDAAPQSRADAILREAGWDGKKPVVAICPIHPFWWPVKPDLVRAAGLATLGEFRTEHYRSIYFHHQSEEADQKFAAYTDALSIALQAFCDERDVFPILIGMEKLDRLACETMARTMRTKPALFISDEYDMYDLIAVVRSCRVLVSSRYHAVVTSMSGPVASGGVTMDERIRNIMNDRGQPELYLEVDDPDLADRCLSLLRHLDDNYDHVVAGVRIALPDQLERMGGMGRMFLDEARRIYPELSTPELGDDPWAYLPSLPPMLQEALNADSAK